MERTEDPHTSGRVTQEELAGMPDLGRCELVRGRIVLAHPTSRSHARVEAAFARELGNFVEPRGLGEVLVGEAGVSTARDPDTVRGADVAFLSAERAARCRPKGFLDVAPDLIVEVLSPGDRPKDVEEKIAEYLSAGVRLVWVADPECKTVRVHRGSDEWGAVGTRGPPGTETVPPQEVASSTVEELSGDDDLSGESVLPGFRVPVRRFFGG
jgi:Uma2 family endonuclease